MVDTQLVVVFARVFGSVGNAHFDFRLRLGKSIVF